MGAVTLIDVEHASKLGDDIIGYTNRYGARVFSQLKEGSGRSELKVKAVRAIDWEALFYTALDVVLHEFAYWKRTQALEAPATFWGAARSEMWLKNPLLDDFDDVSAFMSRFANEITAVTGMGTDWILDSEKDSRLEKQMTGLFTYEVSS